jgi:hypothetical protein
MDLLRIFVDRNLDLGIIASKWLIFFLVLLGLVWFILKRFYNIGTRNFEIEEVEIGVGNQKLRLKPNNQDRQIAYQIWVELSTRKIGLEIDFENDALIEIYDSWYEFFKITRELVKSIPIEQIRRSESTRKLVNLSIEVLNQGVRPHLTKWQARFRQWYQTQIRKDPNSEIDPQELQMNYPDYESLTLDMKQVNLKLIYYRKVMCKLALE